MKIAKRTSMNVHEVDHVKTELHVIIWMLVTFVSVKKVRLFFQIMPLNLSPADISVFPESRLGA